LEYFSAGYLESFNMYIYRALKKHGYSNFSLTILEYCEPYKCIEREKHYRDLFKSEHKYNISLDPTLSPMSGRKHTEESKQKISDAMIGENNPMFGLNHSDESKQKISDSNKGKKKPAGSGVPSKAIEVIDIKENTTITYNSMSEAARALNINQAVIVNYFARNKKKAYKGKYYFKALQPHYNILKEASNSLGYIYSEITRVKMAAVKVGNSNGNNQSKSQQIEVLDLKTNKRTVYNYLNDAANTLSC
jgi:group I intron endonuclease